VFCRRTLTTWESESRSIGDGFITEHGQASGAAVLLDVAASLKRSRESQTFVSCSYCDRRRERPTRVEIFCSSSDGRPEIHVAISTSNVLPIVPLKRLTCWIGGVGSRRMVQLVAQSDGVSIQPDPQPLRTALSAATVQRHSSTAFAWRWMLPPPLRSKSTIYKNWLTTLSSPSTI